MTETIPERLATIRERISQAAKRSGRDPNDVTLVVVTKTWPTEVVIEAYEAGIRHIGENRAEELAVKRSEVEEVLGRDSGLIWHLIGALQSRKTTLAADCADRFHALDRLKVATRLSRRLEDTEKQLPVFLEVNISGELSKAGFECWQWEDDEEQRNKLQKAATTIQQLPGLQPIGLMTMAPWLSDKDRLRDIFQRTYRLSTWLDETMPSGSWSSLSMGMSDDFELAVEEGATHVRIGRAILGPRR
ncbi:MAG: YggS family pyridoxal phosphate-dependent enzyme [Candidatus Promineifilaceae bacterium]